ncbi:MAG: hypothetical protein AB8H86_04550 [Polyangiales bacterium]
MKFVLLALVGAAAVFFLTRSAKKRGGGPQRLWSKLHSLTHDQALAERLVAGEMRRNPELSEAQCVKRAISQLQRDRGR